MSDVPETPKEFFTQYIPKRFDLVKAGLAGKTSTGSMTFRVLDAGEWSLRLVNGELQIEEGMAEDVVLQITAKQEDFAPIFVQGAILQEGETQTEQQVLAFKVLTVDAERVKLVRAIQGNVSFVISDEAKTHTLVVTPGSQAPKLEGAECRLEVKMGDFMDMQTGKQNPMQLAMSGKIKIVGNAQIPMALSGVLV